MLVLCQAFHTCICTKTEAFGHDQIPTRVRRRSLELSDGSAVSAMRHGNVAWQLCAEVDEEAESKLT